MPGSECLGELLLGELEAQIQIDPSRYFHFQPLQIAAADWGAATTVLNFDTLHFDQRQ